MQENAKLMHHIMTKIPYKLIEKLKDHFEGVEITDYSEKYNGFDIKITARCEDTGKKFHDGAFYPTALLKEDVAFYVICKTVEDTRQALLNTRRPIFTGIDPALTVNNKEIAIVPNSSTFVTGNGRVPIKIKKSLTEMSAKFIEEHKKAFKKALDCNRFIQPKVTINHKNVSDAIKYAQEKRKRYIIPTFKIPTPKA